MWRNLWLRGFCHVDYHYLGQTTIKKQHLKYSCLLGNNFSWWLLFHLSSFVPLVTNLHLKNLLKLCPSFIPYFLHQDAKLNEVSSLEKSLSLSFSFPTSLSTLSFLPETPYPWVVCISSASLQPHRNQAQWLAVLLSAGVPRAREFFPPWWSCPLSPSLSQLEHLIQVFLIEGCSWKFQILSPQKSPYLMLFCPFFPKVFEFLRT